MECRSCRRLVPDASAACPACGAAPADRFLVRAILERAAYLPATDPFVRCLLKLAVVPPADAPRPPESHVLLILDVSASMNAPDRYPLVLESVRGLVGLLPASARLTVVLFSDRVDCPLRLLPVMEVGPEGATRAIETSKAKFGGATRMALGVREAIAQARRFRTLAPDGVQRIYVMTDGQVHDPEECRRAAPDLRALGAEVRAFGFGEDFDLHTLKDLTDGQLGGTIRRIANGEALTRELVHIGETAQRVAASDVRLDLALAPGVIPGEILRYRPGRHRYARIYNPERRAQIEIGSVEVDRLYQYLVEFRLPPGVAGSFAWGTLEIAYTESKRAGRQTVRLLLVRSQDPKLLATMDPEVEEVAKILAPLKDPTGGADRDALLARARRLTREGRDPETLHHTLLGFEAVSAGARVEDLPDQTRAALESETCSEVACLSEALAARLQVAERLLASRPEAQRLVEIIRAARRAVEAGDNDLAGLSAADRAAVATVLRELGLAEGGP